MMKVEGRKGEGGGEGGKREGEEGKGGGGEKRWQ